MRQQNFIVVLMVGLVGGLLTWMPEAGALQLSPDRERPLADGQYLTQKLGFAGRARSYAIYVPTTYRAKKRVPLVVVLHGTSKRKNAMNRTRPEFIRAAWVPGFAAPLGDLGRAPLLVPVWHIPGGPAIISYGNWDRMAEAEGFIVAAPNSLGHAFNDGSGRGGPEIETIDDTGFIDAVIDDMLQRYAIDRVRIYMVGLSSGGSMAQTMAIERPEKIAAFTSVMGHLWTEDRAPAPTRPMLLLFGDSDRLNPIDGAVVKYPPPIAYITLDKPAPMRTAELWSKRMGCGERSEPNEGPAVRVVAWLSCRDGAQLLLYIVRNLGHHWPGGPKPSKGALKVAGPYTDAIDATQLIWDFFSQHRRR